jgi:hypothetical protein
LLFLVNPKTFKKKTFLKNTILAISVSQGRK